MIRDLIVCTTTNNSLFFTSDIFIIIVITWAVVTMKSDVRKLAKL